MASRCFTALRCLRSAKPRSPSLYGFISHAHMTSALLSKAQHPHYPANVQTHSTRNMTSTNENKFECINIQDVEDFQSKVRESAIPVIVDFYADWCGPCKMLGPRLESIISEKNGKVLLAKVDVDEHSELAMEFAVESLPTVIAFKNGKVVNKFIGLQDDDLVDVFVEKLIH